MIPAFFSFSHRSTSERLSWRRKRRAAADRAGRVVLPAAGEGGPAGVTADTLPRRIRRSRRRLRRTWSAQRGGSCVRSSWARRSGALSCSRYWHADAAIFRRGGRARILLLSSSRRSCVGVCGSVPKQARGCCNGQEPVFCFLLHGSLLDEAALLGLNLHTSAGSPVSCGYQGRYSHVFPTTLLHPV